jgi:DNA-binding response OmpR family regulator
VATTQSSSGRPTQSVLVIDDEDYVADMIATALTIEGYIVHVAYNGKQGLERAQSLVIDLVIIDIMMPYLSGDELAERLRQEGHLHTVPIIMISAGARPRHQMNGMTFLPKPFDIDDILTLVEAHIGRPPEEQTSRPFQTAS